MPDVDVVDGNDGEGYAQPARQTPQQGDYQNVAGSHMICIDKVAAGEYVFLIDAPKGQCFDVSARPQYEARGFLCGVAFKVQPRPAPAAAPVQKKKRSILSPWGKGS